MSTTPGTPFWTPILYDVGHALGSVDNAEARIDRVLEIMRAFVPYDRSALLEDVPVLPRSISVAPACDARERDALASRLGNLLALISERPVGKWHQVKMERTAGRAHLAVPMLSLGEATGILFVERDNAPYDESHLAFLSTVAAQIGAYLSAVKAHRELQASEAKFRRLYEDRERDLELLQMFMGMLGHDLRNPLTAIRVSAESLRRVAEPRVARPTARLLASSERMERLVNQLLDLTRIRLAGGLPVQRERVDLAEVCRTAVDELMVVHPDAHINIDIEGEVVGEWDRDRLLQVVSNLVGNAVEHAKGSREVSLRVARDEADVELTVRNAGVIPEDLRAALFDPFRKHNLQGNRKGLGLGLFIIKQIVDAHGGAIAVDSSESSGTIITVRLPRAPRSATGPRPSESPRRH